MGRDIETTEFTRDDRLQFREKVKANLAALRTLVDSGSFETGRRTCGVEMEVYITNPEGSPVPINAQLLERMASADFQTELAKFTIEFDVKPRLLTGHVFHTIDTRAAPVAQPRTRRRRGPRRSCDDHRHSPDPQGPRCHRGIHVRQRALPGTQRHDPQRSGRGHPDQDRRRRGGRDEGQVDPVRGRLHLDAAAPAGRPPRLRPVLERRPAAVRPPGGGRGELALLPRQAAPSRDPDRTVRTGHRHAHRGAGAAGRATPGVVRREVARRGRGSVGPVRRERPLLPCPAAHLRRRGPGSDDRGGCGAHAAGADAAQRNDLPLEPSGVRGRAGPSTHEDREPRAAGRTVGPGLRRQRRLLLRAAPRSRLPGRGRTSGSR